ncbi:NADH dehydrogenase [ubiquinone] 1 alpha subcomplex assembly factor 2 [Dermatophagoides pteronyssinus]|uniref:Uncharacterized protein n=2 Tax=Dermatophagoides pteronyssinus TaxID=6956 RepID=A0ABQ8JQ59_DERPT|nr:NADH dehydrogenase [ubiquinone] 1 alpha subcomplex assembly factor 2-like [Dermatophagoides pteronyssinus]KAH9424436.1 hypothetical protein DERP_004621 [Dermatophagoides pteronyssinus]
MADRGMNPFVKAFWNFVRTLKPSRLIGSRPEFIGSDHLGNKYFEIKNDINRNSKTVRYFQSTSIDNWDDLPPEWNAWLRMRRQDPPTIEESMRNLQRIKKFQSQQKSSSETKIDPESTVFPKFDEYEQSPGSKYKP